MKGTIYNYEKQNIDFLSSITVSGSEIHFNDAYGNSKDVDLGRFIGLRFEDPEEVMVSLEGKNNVWLPASWALSYYCSTNTMAVIHTNKNGEDESFTFKASELREIVFEDDDLPEYDYELMIHYLNGETDEYYKRTAGNRWETEARTKEEALEEMKRIDPDTFDEMAKCENVDYYEVAEVKYKVIGNEVVENMDDETVTFDTYAEAFDQIKEWEKLDKHVGWYDEYRIIEVIA